MDARIPILTNLHAGMGARIPTMTSTIAVNLPDTPLLVAGALGGPFVIGSLTPLRNACTLAAQDQKSSLMQLYRRVFSAGVHSGWTGATAPSATAAVQFTVLGPGYHFYLGILGSPAGAVAGCALTENVITYASTVRNAQLMHNRLAAPSERVPVLPLRVAGPGFVPMLLRNVLANAGIRVLSTPMACAVARMSGDECQGSAPCSGASRVAGDFLASITCGAVSMPFNQLFNFQVTSKDSLAASPIERARLGLRFLQSQYLVPGAGGSTTFSRLVLRDAALRSCYIGCLFSAYAGVERAALHVAGR